MALIARRRVRTPEGVTYSAIYHWCQACDQLHGVWVNEQPGDTKESPRWTFNGNMERPTFTPSVRCFTNHDDDGNRLPNNGERTLCHYFVTDGKIAYCGDSPHAYKGQTVPLKDIPPGWFGDE